MFIKRIHLYAVKLLSNGASRIYIQNSEILRAANLPAGTIVNARYEKNRITITRDANGSNKVMGTQRGELLELKNQMTREAIGCVTRVTATFRSGKVIITLCKSDRAQAEREHRILNTNKPYRIGSFFSGLGMLSYFIKQGLMSAGVKTQMAFSNELDPLAMSCNMEGNPIWRDATSDAIAVCAPLSEVDLNDIPTLDIVEAGYPCVGQTTLCAKASRDIEHDTVGLLFIDFIAALKKANAAIIIMENAPAFINSNTLRYMEKELIGYRFEKRNLQAYNFGDIESRNRSVVIAISSGLPEINLDLLMPPEIVDRKTFGHYLNNVPADSTKFRHFAHLHRKDACTKVNYKNKLYRPEDDRIATITATYGAPKAGAPYVAHPTDPMLQRAIEPSEHSRIRHLPEPLKVLIDKVVDGSHPLVSTRGSITAAHRLMGNGVARFVWEATGNYIGRYLQSLKSQSSINFG